MRGVLGAGSLRSLVQLAWMCLFSSVPHGGAKVLEKTFEEWLRYRDECLRRMASEPYPAGLFCNRTFDMYACWPDGSPGTAVNVSCPFYLPWFEKVKHGLVSRRCGTDGQWVTVNGSQPWRDYSQCEDEPEVTAEEEGARRLMVSFKVLYTVGYSLSLLTLISALLILTVCRNLRCTRNYIHANLFASFGLRATSVMVKDALLERRWGVELLQVADWEALLSHEASAGLVAAWGPSPRRGRGGVGAHAAPDTRWVSSWGSVVPVLLMGEVLGYLCTVLGCPSTHPGHAFGVPAAQEPVGEPLGYLCPCWVSSGPVWHLRDELSVPPMPLLGELWGCLCSFWGSSQGTRGPRRELSGFLGCLYNTIPPWMSSCSLWESRGVPHGHSQPHGGSPVAGSAGVPCSAGADAVLHPGQPLLVPGGSCLPLQAAHRGRVLREELLQALPLPGLGDPRGVCGALDGCQVPEGERGVLGAEREHGLLVDHPHPNPARLPDQPAHLHADPQGDPGQAPGQPEGLRRLQAEAGQSHPDPHSPLRDPRGRFHLRHRRANHGHPALRQGVLHPLPQLLPGLPGGCAVLLCQQGGEVRDEEEVAALEAGPPGALLCPVRGDRPGHRGCWPQWPQQGVAGGQEAAGGCAGQCPPGMARLELLEGTSLL
ncbi:collagen alpha-1(XVI) chain-like isoform X2 [Parus major]|uniref:collagen alpha-1(XVI) chain-like isoform X2 n=1 Tax=Parus major TaxID=9157 RepID=UPI00077110FA|nr:collagen alpha-1(XVI) chain-like isoform X2 [Parus major]